MSWLSKLLGADDRNQRLAAWGQSIPVSATQSTAMREIWEAAKAKRPPALDPLACLSPNDRAYIIEICGADFRPAEFGSADVPRMVLFKKLINDGFTHDQAAVVVGMTFNMVGPTDL